MKRLLLLLLLVSVSVPVFGQNENKFGRVGLYVLGVVSPGGGGAVGVSGCVLESSPATFCGTYRGNVVIVDSTLTRLRVSDPNSGVFVTQDVAELSSNKAYWGSALFTPVRKGPVWFSGGVSVGQMKITSLQILSNPTGLDKYKQVYGFLPFGVSPTGSSSIFETNHFFLAPTFQAKVPIGPMTVFGQYMKMMPKGAPKTDQYAIGAGYHF